MRAEKIEKLEAVLSRIRWADTVLKRGQPSWVTYEKWQWNIECEKRFIARLQLIFNKILEQLKFEQ